MHLKCNSIFSHTKLSSGCAPASQASDSEVIISRCTPEYELYIVFGPLVTKPIADAACNRVLKWVKREERALFLGPGHRLTSSKILSAGD
eukprot:4619701-Pleurochrysis_carterae.AAC.4